MSRSQVPLLEFQKRALKGITCLLREIKQTGAGYINLFLQMKFWEFN